jgi:small multidrug resistance family-3 protein
MGCLVLIAYGFAPTLQPMTSFGRIFAVYGGFFIVLSYLWGYVFDGMVLDMGDYIGAGISLAGVCIAWFWPRRKYHKLFLVQRQTQNISRDI